MRTPMIAAPVVLCRHCRRVIVPRFWGRVDGFKWSHAESKRVACDVDAPNAEPANTEPANTEPRHG